MLIGPDGIHHTYCEKIQCHNEWDFYGKHIVFAKAELNQIRGTKEDAQCCPAENPEIHHIQKAEQLIAFLRGFGGIMVADAGS